MLFCLCLIPHLIHACEIISKQLSWYLNTATDKNAHHIPLTYVHEFDDSFLYLLFFFFDLDTEIHIIWIKILSDVVVEKINQLAYKMVHEKCKYTNNKYAKF